MPDSEEGYHVTAPAKLPDLYAHHAYAPTDIQPSDKIDDNDNGTDTLDTYLRGGPFGISRSRRRNKLHLQTVR